MVLRMHVSFCHGQDACALVACSSRTVAVRPEISLEPAVVPQTLGSAEQGTTENVNLQTCMQETRSVIQWSSA